MTNEEVVVRKRRTRTEIEQVVREYEASGLNRSQFCRNQGLALITLNRYLKRVHQGFTTSGIRGGDGLLAVDLRGGRIGDRESGCGLFLVLSGGRRIEIGPDFDAPTLQRLLQILETM